MGALINLNGHTLGVARDQFLRYRFPVKQLLRQNGTQNTLQLSFNRSLTCDGRWMACSGGWDWAPYSTTTQEGALTFSKGIWKSVYLVGLTSAEGEAVERKESVPAIVHMTPLVQYDGPYATTPLTEEHKGNFTVQLRLHLWAAAAGSCSFRIASEWRAEVVSLPHTFPVGDSSLNITLQARSEEVKLWWPVGSGAQPLYEVNVSVVPQGFDMDPTAAVPTVTRRIGFRSLALVTGNDTDPAYVRRAASEEGTELHGMFFRINGALIFMR